ncbi:MAG: hypothetical protein JWM78_1902 [Verrucomicrobiaceae bacterium]|nr:hypothetical protein [Verrucomicrobiaceae bacterium]
MSKTPTSHTDQARVKPWNRKNPYGNGKHKHLSPEQKAKAKHRAEAAGRPYPNLVDNMWAARQREGS